MLTFHLMGKFLELFNKLLDWRTILALCLLVIVIFGCIHWLARNPNEAGPTVKLIGDIYAKFHPQDSPSIDLTSTVLLRIPVGDSNPPNAARFQDFHRWLVDKYGGWSRWKVDSQTDASSGEAEKWIYMIAIADRTRLGAGSNISAYIEQNFGKPYLVIEVPENKAIAASTSDPARAQSLAATLMR